MFTLKCNVCGITLNLELPKHPYDREQMLFDLFAKIDEDKSGSVDRNEFLGFLKLMNDSSTKQESNKIFDFLDADESDSVEFIEFLEWIEAIVTLFFAAHKRAPRGLMRENGK